MTTNTSIELISYGEYGNPEAVARQLHTATIASQDLLEQRNINGPLVRYGQNVDTAIYNVQRAINLHSAREMGCYAVIGESGDIVGAASIYPDLELRRQFIPMAPIIAQGFLDSVLTIDYPYASPNINAWTVDSEGLDEAYRQLLIESRQSPVNRQPRVANADQKNRAYAWTAEPIRSPGSVHEQISAAGMYRMLTGKRLADQESRRHVPPKANLYSSKPAISLSKSMGLNLWVTLGQ